MIITNNERWSLCHHAKDYRGTERWSQYHHAKDYRSPERWSQYHHAKDYRGTERWSQYHHAKSDRGMKLYRAGAIVDEKFWAFFSNYLPVPAKKNRNIIADISIYSSWWGK